MSDQQKLVKVRILKPVSGWTVGQIIEVQESMAQAMTTERQIHNGSHLENYRTAEIVGDGEQVTTATNINGLSVKDMSDLGLKNTVATPPQGFTANDEGQYAPRLSTTTNESVPVSTGAPLASVQATDLDQKDLSASEGKGYDGANILSHDREEFTGKATGANKGQKATVSKIADAKNAAHTDEAHAHAPKESLLDKASHAIHGKKTG